MYAFSYVECYYGFDLYPNLEWITNKSFYSTLHSCELKTLSTQFENHRWVTSESRRAFWLIAVLCTEMSLRISPLYHFRKIKADSFRYLCNSRSPHVAVSTIVSFRFVSHFGKLLRVLIDCCDLFRSQTLYRFPV